MGRRDRKNDKNKRQQKAQEREARKRDACIAKNANAPKREAVIVRSAVVPTHETFVQSASSDLVRRFDEALAGLGEPADRYFPSRHSMLKSNTGAFRSMDDVRAEVSPFIREWLWKMRHAEEPVVLRSNHGTAVGYTFDIKTECGSYTTDFGLYIEPDDSVHIASGELAACMSWSHKFIAAYGLEERLRRAHAAMFTRLMHAYGLRLTA